MPQLGRPVCAVQQADYEFQTLWWQDKQAANTNAMTNGKTGYSLRHQFDKSAAAQPLGF